MDGHGGPQVAEYTSQKLLSTILPKLETENITDAVEETFKDIEMGYKDMIIDPFALGFGSVSSVGSCVLVVIITNDNNNSSKHYNSFILSI